MKFHKLFIFVIVLSTLFSCGSNETEVNEGPTPWTNSFLFGNFNVNGEDLVTTNLSTSQSSIVDEISATKLTSRNLSIITFNIYIPHDATKELLGGFDTNNSGIIVELDGGNFEELPVSLSFNGIEDFGTPYSSFTVSGNKAANQTLERSKMNSIRLDFDMVYKVEQTDEEVFRQARNITINICNAFCENSSEANALFTQGPGVSDLEGNFYETVIIDGKEWMAENLRSTKIGSGANSLFLVSDSANWERTSNTGEIYCYVNNDPSTVNEYGLLYTWNAARRGICPPGFHLPTNEDWEDLVNYLGGDNKAYVNFFNVGDELRSQEGWSFNGNNKSGLNIKPAPFRRQNGTFVNSLEMAGFWSRDQDGDPTDNFYGSFVEIDKDEEISTNIDKGSWPGRLKGEGKSCRCVKD